ncbi:cytochrome B5-like protein isoform X1 [Cinnamomum micranthum f. kanehirae]|uniref:Cytochrome B5-like protein isoform X1 n=1 Tax=Cinnamomum micranthum f. kanehirae TaxID=337451 RepID=A0A443NL14_9MAGN|nr:cytochrome B5-like protein isoform X1 [Cinnamomum micranthum f. kanehirae]
MEMIVMTLILGAIFGAFFLISRVIKSGNSEVVHSNAASKALKLFTKDEVSRHNSRTDCWIIIKDKVYDVTPYVEEHPGGDAILAHAGDDSTEGFYGPQHATRVFDMVDEFYIGDLKR